MELKTDREIQQLAYRTGLTFSILGYYLISDSIGRENYHSGDLLNEVKGKINLVGGILSVDDTVIDKPYSQLRNVIGYFWSGKHKRGI